MIYCPDGRTISPFRVAIAFTVIAIVLILLCSNWDAIKNFGISFPQIIPRIPHFSGTTRAFFLKKSANNEKNAGLIQA